MSQTKTLNIVPDDSLKRIHLSQGDLGRTLIFKLFEGSASYSPPTGASVKIVGTKPSGVGYAINGTFSDNTVTIVTTSAMTDEYGAVESELIVTNQAETEIFKSANFLLMIEKDPHPAGTVDGESSVVVPTLLQLQSSIGDLTQLNTTDKTSLVGAINELKASGNGGLTNDIKEALLDCFAHVAWIDEDGQDYYDALHDALYPPANLTSITCVYTQSGTVYDTDTLDSLKTDLVVTAHFDNNTTQTVTTYTLSGTLTEGTSTITVTYSGKTTTFNVTVTEYVEPYIGVEFEYPKTLTWNPNNSSAALTEALGAQGAKYRVEVDVTSITSPNAYIKLDVSGGPYSSGYMLATFNDSGQIGATGTLTKIVTLNEFNYESTTLKASCNKGTESANQTAVISDIRIYEVTS